MPNIKSAVKRNKTSAERRLRNRATKSLLTTAAKRLEAAVASGDKTKSEAVLREFSSSYDKAAKRGIISANNANRHKARAAAKLAKMAASIPASA